jgi:hypothetical protein
MKVASRSQINDFKDGHNDLLFSPVKLLKIQIFSFSSAVPKPLLAQFQWANKGIKRCANRQNRSLEGAS